MEFKKYKLGELGDICMCKRIMKAETAETGDVPFYKIGTFGGTPDVYISKELFNTYKNKFSFPKVGDVLISAAGTIGRSVIYNGEEAYFQDSNIVWIDNDETKVLNSFLFYIYKNIRWKISTGSTILRLYNDNIRETEIIVPNIEDQRSISGFLSTIDDKITLNTRMNAELEAMAKQLYDYWFVQFDFPDENGKPYKSSDGKMVYNETLKREIPEGWEVKNLNQMVESFRGVTYNKEDLVLESEDSILVLRGNNIPSSGQFAYDSNVAYIPKGMVSNEQRINKGDIIITMSSGSKEHIGKCFMFQRDSDHTFGAFLSKFVPYEEYRYFVYLSMLSDFFKAFVKTTCNGTGINNLTNDTFNNVYFPIPDANTLKVFESITGSLYNKVGLCQKQNNDLTHLRDSLLPMLMNGQVIVE